MERAREIAGENGATQVIWTVWRKNLPAQSFYHHFGAADYKEEILMAWPPTTRRSQMASRRDSAMRKDSV